MSADISSDFAKSVLSPPKNRNGCVKPLAIEHLEGVADLFSRVFRPNRAVDRQAIADYTADLLLTSPIYNPNTGSTVYIQADGQVRSALLCVPMRFVAFDKPLEGRLLCVYMTDADKEAAGAADLILKLRAKRVDFAFCDSASPVSFAFLEAIGGQALRINNLEWVRVFKPARWIWNSLFTRIDRFGLRRLGTMTGPLDRLIVNRSSHAIPLAGKGTSVRPMPVAAFIETAPELVAHFAVRPEWKRDELTWLITMAERNTTLGILKIFQVTSGEHVDGCFLYYSQAKSTAQVLNILARRGKEKDVVDAMMGYFAQAGYAEARGRALQPFVEGLSLQRWLYFRHKAFTSVLTKHSDIVDAVARGDIYVGGLAGEDWSRLVSDF